VAIKRSKLTEMIDRSPAGDTFLVPAPLCFPVTRNTYDNGAALRVLYGILWISAEILRSGADVGIGATLAEIRIASGFERYDKDGPVIDVLPTLAEEKCDLKDGGTIKIFERLEITDKDARSVEWVFTKEFSEMFISPRVFAIVSISEIVHLKSGLDFFMYLQIRRIWRMNNKLATLNAADLKRSSGLGEETSFQRVAERVRRTSGRLEKLLCGEISLKPMRAPGERKHGEIKVEIKAHA
jgi:hypothetical protein